MKVIRRVALGIAGLCCAASAFAYGEVGQWSSGWGQGVSEYAAVVSPKTQLYIACSDSVPVSMTLTVEGKSYGSSEAKGFDLVIDGKAIETPYLTDSRVGANNFIYVWDALRKAKAIVAKTEDGKLVKLPTKGVAKALPASASKDFPCSVAF